MKNDGLCWQCTHHQSRHAVIRAYMTKSHARGGCELCDCTLTRKQAELGAPRGKSTQVLNCTPDGIPGMAMGHDTDKLKSSKMSDFEVRPEGETLQ